MPPPPPPPIFCIKDIRKIIQKSFLGKLLNQGLQTNRVIFRLNEILARYLRKGTEIGEKKNAFNPTQNKFDVQFGQSRFP